MVKEQFREADGAKTMWAPYSWLCYKLHIYLLQILLLISLLTLLKTSKCVACFRENVTFGLMSAEQMRKQSHIHVVSKNLYAQDGSRKHVPFGVLDHRMVSRDGPLAPPTRRTFLGKRLRAFWSCIRAPVKRTTTVRRVVVPLQTVLGTMVISILSYHASILATSGVV